MTCTCQNCGETAGQGGVRSGMGIGLYFFTPIWFGAITWPIYDRWSWLLPWELFRRVFAAYLLLIAWFLLRFWFTSFYFWLIYTIFKPCPKCRKRRWSLGECSGFGL